MRWNRPQNTDGSMTDVNMTPLIDVSLVLVVILLLATPLAFESSFGVRKTGATARRADEVEKEARIELAIETDQTVRVNKTVVSIDDLIWGGLGVLSADTVVGPVYMAYGRTENGSDSFYMGIGSNF